MLIELESGFVRGVIVEPAGENGGVIYDGSCCVINSRLYITSKLAVSPLAAQ